MKHITFASFKGGAGKTTAVMAVTSALADMGKRIALIDADENMPLLEWRDRARKVETWSDDISIYEADDLKSFETAFQAATNENHDYAIIDTHGGGSELNNACLINTDLVIIPSALTTLDMTQALSTFEHVVGLHHQTQTMIPTNLLLQRVPVGKLTVSQRRDLEALSELPCCKTQLHARDAFATLGKRGLLQKAYEQVANDPMNRISASHMAIAMDEARTLATELIKTLGDT